MFWPLTSCSLTVFRRTISNITMSESEILTTLQSLNPSKSSGPDVIPSRLLKELAPEISSSITCIFNKSLYEGSFQVSGKIAILRLFSKLIKKTSSPTIVELLYYRYYLKSLRDMSIQDCIIMSRIF